MILKAVSLQVCTGMKVQGLSSLQSVPLVMAISVLCIKKLLAKSVDLHIACFKQTVIFEITMNSSINDVHANAYWCHF